MFKRLLGRLINLVKDQFYLIEEIKIFPVLVLFPNAMTISPDKINLGRKEFSSQF